MTLNAVLSAWLVQENSPSMKLSSLLARSGMIYEYIKEKPKVKTYMTYKPMKSITSHHIDGLGFKMKNLSKNEGKILLNTKEDDLRVRLILAYYSMPLVQSFLMEGCLAMYLKNEVLTNDYIDGK